MLHYIMYNSVKQPGKIYYTIWYTICYNVIVVCNVLHNTYIVNNNIML